MKEQFVTYEIALKLKKLGFDEPCIAFFNTKNENSLSFCDLFGFLSETDEEDFFRNSMEKNCAAPLWQQVIDWLELKNVRTTFYDTKYIAREQSILKAIELCQKK